MIEDLIQLGLNPDDIELIEEFFNRQDHEYLKYTPLAGQKEFHESTSYIRMLMGGNQSGKSRSNAQEVAWWLTGDHPHRTLPERPRMIWVISTEYQTIRAGIYRHLLNILPYWEIKGFGPRVQGHDLHSYIKMKNGSTVYFLSSKGGEDARTKFQAEAVDYVAIDEEIEEFIWDELQARLLATGGGFGISATLVESYDWILSLERRAAAGDPDVFLIRLLTNNNPYLNQEQIKRLESQWDNVTKEYRLYGKSRRRTGLVYPNFEHWCEPFDIPQEWTRYQVLDPGYRVFAGLWAAVSPYGQLFLYRELYQKYSDLPTVVNEIKFAEQSETIDFRVIDDKEGSHLITGQAGVLGILASEYGLYYTPAIKAVLSGIELTRAWLRTHKTDEEYEYLLDNKQIISFNKGQRLFAFTTLENFRNEVTSYRINPDKAKRDKSSSADTPIKKADHLMDCWRYLCSAHPAFHDRSVKQERSPNYYGSVDLITAFENQIKRSKEPKVDEFFGSCI
jgi:hypothetical protein